MTKQDPKIGPNKAEHDKRAAEALRDNLRRRKDQQRKEKAKPEEQDDR